MEENLLDQKEYTKMKRVSLLLLVILVLTVITIIILIIVIAKSGKSDKHDKPEDHYKGFDYWVQKYKMMDHIEGGKFQYGLYASSFTVNLTDYEGVERAQNALSSTAKGAQAFEDVYGNASNIKTTGDGFNDLFSDGK